MAKNGLSLSDEFEFVSIPVNKDYFCPVSLEVMMNPRQTDCCGTHISTGVAEKLAAEGNPCPLCKASCPGPHTRSNDRVFTTHRDQYFQRIILDQTVRCPHRKNSCEWIGPLREVRDHSASCSFRPWICQYCRFTTSYKIGTTQHAQTCQLRPILCSCSSDYISYSKLEEHKKVCPMEMVACDFADVGCTITLRRKNLVDHLKSCLMQHQLLVSRKTLSVTLAMQASSATVNPKMSLEDSSQQLKEKDAKILELKGRVMSLSADLNAAREELVRVNGELREKGVVEVRELLDEVKKNVAVSKLQEQVCSQAEQLLKELVRIRGEVEEKDAVGVRELIDELKMRNASDLQINRLQEQIHSLEEQHQRLLQKALGDGDAETTLSNVGVMVTDVLENLKSKKNLNDKEIKKVVTGLENIMVSITDRRPAGGDEVSLEGYIMASSPVNFPKEKKEVEEFRGQLERTLIRGLKRAWGVTVVGEDVYVIDTNGSHGVHKVNNGSVTRLIESASFTDVRIPLGKCWYPRCIALDQEGNMFLADTGSHRILKFSPDGTLLAQAGKESSPGSSSDVFCYPIGIALDANENVYVSDRSNHRIQMLTSELEWVSTFGKKGSDSMEFLNPWDVTFDREGNIYVADCGNRCVKVFTPEFSPLRMLGKAGKKYRIGDLRAPTSVCVDHKGNVYVTDVNFKAVLMYNSAGEYTRTFGQFLEPYGISVDSKGRVYVSDNGGHTGMLQSDYPGRVQIFT